jgi:UDP-2,4-diacetamido-2,4,6-trideoxy-beta-L-altropyranose hydrolase
MERPATLVVRADANSAMGAGHVMRCLALAQAWRDSGHDAIYCGQIDSDSLRRRLSAAGFLHLETGPAIADTIRMLHEQGLAGCRIVLDGYHFGSEWQTELVTAGYLVMVMDDGARLASYAAHVIVAAEQDARASAYVTSPSTLILTGSRFRLLRPGFTQLARSAREITDGSVVLISFGGADSTNATRSVVLALDQVLRPADKALVVLGPVNRHSASVKQALDGVGYRYELHQDVDDMSALYARADLAVGAAGGAAWEMAVSGLPAVLMPVAENQQAGMEFLTRAGAAVGLAGPDAIVTKDFAVLVKALLESPSQLVKMSAKGRGACDGNGAMRVCQILASLTGEQRAVEYVLRPAEPGDMEQVFRLANDPLVRQNSFSLQAISLAQHTTWYAERLASSRTVFYVLDLVGVVAALARFDMIGDVAEIDVAVHPAFRGRGLGARILRESAGPAAARLGVSELRAAVFEGNAESRRCFARAGFQETGFDTVKGKPCALFAWTTSDMDACLD